MQVDGTFERISKKEALGLTREMTKLQRSLGGIKELSALPDALFIIDVGYQKGAVQEANKLGVPVIGVVDTNHNPEGIALRDPGQRRLQPRHPAVRARHGRRGAGRPHPVAGGSGRRLARRVRRGGRRRGHPVG